MTIASQTSRIAYTGDGSTTAFSVPFFFQSNSDIVVSVQDLSGNVLIKTLGADYNLSGATISTGGTCTFVTAPTLNYKVAIYRVPPLTQTTSYNNNDPFPAKSHEAALDKLVTIDQYLKNQLDRTIMVAATDNPPMTTLPPAATRALQYLAFDSLGNPIAGTPSGTSPPISSVMQPVVASSTVAIARGLLGVPDAFTTRTALKAVDTTKVSAAYLSEVGREGEFIFRAGDYAARISADTQEALYLKANAISASSGAWVRIYSEAASLKWFGATGDGSTDDQTAIAAAISYCGPAGISLGIPDGTYAHSNTLVWAYPNFKVVALGPNVVFKHTGGGVAHNFNGLTNGSSTQGVFKNVFGGQHRISLVGNPAGTTTKLAYVNNWHQSEMTIRGRDAKYILFGENTGLGQAAAVSSHFDVQASANGDGTAFALAPDVGLYLSAFFGCVFQRCIVEQCGSNSNPGMLLVGSANNVFVGGTSESCLAGGIQLDANSSNNLFQGMDFEVNGTGYDILCNGYCNIFQGCTTGTTALGSLIQGIDNIFIGCTLNAVNDNGQKNTYQNCTLVTSFAQSGSGTSIINPNGSVSLNPKIFFGNLQIISGTGAPSMVAEQGSLYIRKDGSSTTTRLYSNTAGGSVWTPFTSGS